MITLTLMSVLIPLISLVIDIALVICIFVITSRTGALKRDVTELKARTKEIDSKTGYLVYRVDTDKKQKSAADK